MRASEVTPGRYRFEFEACGQIHHRDVTVFDDPQLGRVMQFDGADSQKMPLRHIDNTCSFVAIEPPFKAGDWVVCVDATGWQTWKLVRCTTSPRQTIAMACSLNGECLTLWATGFSRISFARGFRSRNTLRASINSIVVALGYTPSRVRSASSTTQIATASWLR